jgi:hypothetical protein
MVSATVIPNLKLGESVCQENFSAATIGKNNLGLTA